MGITSVSVFQVIERLSFVHIKMRVVILLALLVAVLAVTTDARSCRRRNTPVFRRSSPCKGRSSSPRRSKSPRRSTRKVRQPCVPRVVQPEPCVPRVVEPEPCVRVVEPEPCDEPEDPVEEEDCPPCVDIN